MCCARTKPSLIAPYLVIQLNVFLCHPNANREIGRSFARRQNLHLVNELPEWALWQHSTGM
jgi:hypothetical protein